MIQPNYGFSHLFRREVESQKAEVRTQMQLNSGESHAKKIRCFDCNDKGNAWVAEPNDRLVGSTLVRPLGWHGEKKLSWEKNLPCDRPAHGH